MTKTSQAIKESLNARLAEGWTMLPKDPAGAEAKAHALLEIAPGLPDALLLSGRAAAMQGRGGDALRAFHEATMRAPFAPQAWRAFADLLYRIGETENADRAFGHLIETSIDEPRLKEASALLRANRAPDAEKILRHFLQVHPNDVAAMRLLAEVATRAHRIVDAEAMLSRALDRSASFANARFNRALLRLQLNRAADALADLDKLLTADPKHPNYLGLQAAALSRIGEHARALACFETLVELHPDQPTAWTSYGHALRTLGRRDEAIAAYRRALALKPCLGEGWWSLANLKTFAFSDADIAAVEAALAGDEASPEDRTKLHFALGKAREDRGEDEAAFRAYQAGNGPGNPHAGNRAVTELVDRSVALFTPSFFAARAGQGADAQDPIFILGMPRSGSTLIEQILASHPAIEGTQELPDIREIAQSLTKSGVRGENGVYPGSIGELSADDLRDLGVQYLERTRIQRKTERAFFIDKMPSNWAHTGLIHLILPNATIIDTRRHPLACGFSNFKQHFERGRGFSYDLAEIGRHTIEYVRMMAHIDAVLPGRVHRVFYETLIDDTEAELRRLLDHIGLPFDPACLAFHRSDRAVRTPSSEQVRRPISRDALDTWRRFDAWLGPLKETLGGVLDAYPDVPAGFKR